MGEDNKVQTDYSGIPLELKSLKQWGLFKLKWQPDRNKYAKYPKNPYTGGDGKSNDPSTWADFDTALQAMDDYGMDGLGFYFQPPYIGIDVDHLEQDLERWKSGDVDDNEVQHFLTITKSYTETSVSGTGIHIIVKGKIPGDRRRSGNVEMYTSGRFFAMTGNQIGPHNEVSEPEPKLLKLLYDRYLKPSTVVTLPNQQLPQLNDLSETEVIARAESSRTGQRFKLFMKGGWEQFYTSQSEADLAFANDLAFWTGRDFTKMDSIFRQSNLMRPKWDEKHGKSTYGVATLNKAINETRDAFHPQATPLSYDFQFKSKPVDATNDINEGLTPYDVSAMPKASYPQPDNPKALEEANQKLATTIPSWLDAYFIQKGVKNPIVELKIFFDYVKLGDSLMNIHRLISFPAMPDGALYQSDMGTWHIFKPKENSKFLESEITKATKPWGVYDDRKVGQATRYVLRMVNKNILNCNPFENSNPAMIAFANGTYNVETKQLEEKRPDNYIISSHNYDLDTTGGPTSETESLLTDMFGDGSLFFMEWIGYGFYRSYRLFNYMVFLRGSGGEGKSTLLDYISSDLYGIDNVASVTPKDLGGNRFSSAELYGMDANIVADVGADFLRQPDVLKKLTGGDLLSAEFKGGQLFKFTSYAKLTFSANELPTFSDDSKGMQRRLVVLELQNSDTRGTDFWKRHDMDKVREERPAFVYRCIQLFAKAKERRKMSLTPQIEAASNEWIKANDHFGQFLEEACEIVNQSEGGESSKVVTAEYGAFCRENNYSDKVTSQTIANKLKARGVTKIRGTHGFGSNDNLWRYMGLKLTKTYVTQN